MKIAKRDLALIMVLVGIIAAFCAYKFYFSGTLDEIDEEKAVQASLEAKKIELEKKSKEVQNMEKEAKGWVTEIETTVAKYDPAYLYEDGIMWMNTLEETFADSTIRSYTVGETYADRTVVGQGNFEGKAYVAGSTSYVYTYALPDYASLKDFVAYITSGKEGVKSLESMTFSQNADGFSGSISMKAYALADGTKDYIENDFSDVKLGIDQIFEKIEKDDKKDN